MPEVEDRTPEPNAVSAPPTAAPPVTDDAAVDAAIALLVEVGDLPLADRPAVFESVHRTLADRLADVES